MTEQALKRKSFIKGLRSFYFGQSPEKKPVTKSDREALYQDWVTVGNSIQKAMNDYERQQGK